MAFRLKTTRKNSDSKNKFEIKELLEIHQKVRSSSVDLFRVLGLEYPATTEDLRRGYEEFLQKFSLLLFSASHNAEIVEKANDVFDKVSKIFDALIIGFNLIDINGLEVN